MAPHEELLVAELIDRVQQDSELAGSQFIVRLHPFDRLLERWRALEQRPDTIVTVPWQVGTDDSGEADRRRCASPGELSETFGLQSEYFVYYGTRRDFYDQPVIAPAYGVGPESGISYHMRMLYERDHYLPLRIQAQFYLWNPPRPVSLLFGKRSVIRPRNVIKGRS